MKKNNTTKLIVALVVFIISVMFTLPSTPLWDSAFGTLTPDEQRGLPIDMYEYRQDADGSVLLTMHIDSKANVFNREKKPERFSDFLDRVCESVRQKLIEMQYNAISWHTDYSSNFRTLKVTAKNNEQITIDKLKSDIYQHSKLYAKLPLDITSIFPSKKITLGLDLKGGLDIVYHVDISSINREDSRNTPEDAVNTSLEIIRRRIDINGIAEPSIKKQEGNRIRVQLPGRLNVAAIKDLIKNTAKLNFHLVLAQDYEANNLMPDPDEIVLKSKGDSNHIAMWYKLKKKPDIGGEDLRFAKVAFDEFGSPVVHIEFNGDGIVKFAQLTSQNVGRQLAIVLDTDVYSAPTIQTKITTGNAQITGRFSLEEAQNLAIVLRTGALPANLVELESRVIGPTLGQNSIKAGYKAGAVGFIGVIAFMILIYKTCGVIADLALIFNSLIVFASLVLFGGTMTMPGIAGFILSVGMAVDANVIIFERIKEEYYSGKTVRASIASGFDRAFSCILDSNITTLLVVAILYYFTSGPIRGFATTLGIGLVANLYTAVFFSKLCLETWFSNHPERKLGL